MKNLRNDLAFLKNVITANHNLITTHPSTQVQVLSALAMVLESRKVFKEFSQSKRKDFPIFSRCQFALAHLAVSVPGNDGGRVSYRTRNASVEVIEQCRRQTAVCCITFICVKQSEASTQLNQKNNRST